MHRFDTGIGIGTDIEKYLDRVLVEMHRSDIGIKIEKFLTGYW